MQVHSAKWNICMKLTLKFDLQPIPDIPTFLFTISIIITKVETQQHLLLNYSNSLPTELSPSKTEYSTHNLSTQLWSIPHTSVKTIF